MKIPSRGKSTALLPQMNRHQRRVAMKQTGHTWASARALAKRQQRDARAEGRFAGLASRMSPAEAGKALDELTARGDE